MDFNYNPSEFDDKDFNDDRPPEGRFQCTFERAEIKDSERGKYLSTMVRINSEKYNNKPLFPKFFISGDYSEKLLERSKNDIKKILKITKAGTLKTVEEVIYHLLDKKVTVTVKHNGDFDNYYFSEPELNATNSSFESGSDLPF